MPSYFRDTVPAASSDHEKAHPDRYPETKVHIVMPVHVFLWFCLHTLKIILLSCNQLSLQFFHPCDHFVAESIKFRIFFVLFRM